LAGKRKAREKSKRQRALAKIRDGVGTTPFVMFSRVRSSRGTGYGDLHRWQRPGWAESVPDSRREQLFCRCGQRVDVVLVDGEWTKRNLDGLPHMLTCTKRESA
jgi:hypothetical protein